MKAETITDLEQQLSIINIELGRTRSELRALQQRQRRTARSTTLFHLSGFLVIVLLATVALAPGGAAQNVAQPSAIVTRLQAPVLIQDKSGHTIVEISVPDSTASRLIAQAVRWRFWALTKRTMESCNFWEQVISYSPRQAPTALSFSDRPPSPWLSWAQTTPVMEPYS